jgi:glycosyltransferase A (GT-A) superfamily protein (DUF2064 family)
MKLAVAVFVKTPGLSPLKTRLAAGIGAAAAHEFYRLACAAVAEVLAGAPDLSPWWAVAEAEGAGRWTGFPVVLQGEGPLGSRLDRVYAQLRAKMPVALIGADAPQLGVAQLEAARAALAGGASFVLGPAADGGFYLFAGRAPVPAEVWGSVPYSATDTAARLAAALAPHGRVAYLEMLTDVDEAPDLLALAREFDAVPELSSAQRDLRDWLARR